MMYPTVTVIDNFFKDPDSIVEIANNLEFYPNSDGAWPGRRTKLLHEVEPEFFEFFSPPPQIDPSKQSGFGGSGLFFCRKTKEI